MARINSPRILVLAGAGTLGHKLWQTLPARFPDAFATIRKSRDFYSKCGLFAGKNVVEGLDLRDLARLDAVLEEIRPAVIVNCAGVTLRSGEARDKSSAIAVNALLPQKLGQWCAARNARLIHFSTVCVFDGKTGGYDEPSPPDARDLYGMTKTLGEVLSPVALTLRSSFIGRELFGASELLEWFLSQKGNRVKGFRKAIFTGLTTNRMAALVADLIEKHPGLSGLYHVASEPVSKYDLLGLMKKHYKTKTEIVAEDEFECRRDLNGDAFVAATGYRCPSWETMMAEMAADPTPYEKWRN